MKGLVRYFWAFALALIVGALGIGILADTAKAGGGGFGAAVQKSVVVQQAQPVYQVQQFAVPVQQVYAVQQVQQVKQFAVVQQVQKVQKVNIGCASGACQAQGFGARRVEQVQRSGPLFSRSRVSIR